MKLIKRTLAVLVCMTQLLSCCVYSAENVPKEETVYAILNLDGSLKDAYVVNSFKISSQKTIVDYGNYSEYKNLTSDSEPKVKNGSVEWKVPDNASSFIYQGKLKKAELPWNFDIKYSIDGKNIKGEKTAGKSGKFMITIDAKTNKRTEQYFTDNYIAQVTMQLDTKRCKNIACEDAIFANVGSTKQLTFMILPGLDKTYEITFDAKNFEMSGLTIGFVRISDGILGTMDTMKAGVSSMASSVSSLVSGTGTLKNGAEDLASGVTLLDSGAQNIRSSLPSLVAGIDTFGNGLHTVDSGMGDLSGGSASVRSALTELDGKSADVSNGISSVSEGLKKITENKDTIVNAKKQLEAKEGDINSLSSGGDTLKSGYKQIETGLSTAAGKTGEIRSGLKELRSANTDVSTLVSGAESVYGGINSAKASLDMLVSTMDDSNPYKAQLKAISEGMTGLVTGAGQVAAGTKQAQSGISSLYSSALTFGSAAEQLAEGSNTMLENMKTLNSGLSTYTNGVNSLTSLYDVSMEFANGSMTMIDGAQQIYDGNEDLRRGFDSYADGVSKLSSNYTTLDDSINALYGGIGTLSSSFDTLSDSTNTVSSVFDEFADSISLLSSGASQLYNGTDTLNSATSQATDLYSEYGGDIASAISASASAEVVSFAAPGVVTPTSVQFVVKTPDIKEDDNEAAAQSDDKGTLLDRILAIIPGGNGLTKALVGLGVLIIIVFIIIRIIKKKKKNGGNKLKKTGTLLMLLLCVSLMFTACGKDTQKKKTEPKKTETKTVQEYFGTLSAESKTEVIPEGKGEIEEASFEVGDKVKKGQLLYRLKDSGIADSIATTKNSITKADISIQTAQTNVNDLSIYAPASGILREFSIKNGERVNAATIGKIVDENKIIASVPFTASGRDKIKIGNSATVTSDDYMVSLSGTVTAVSDSRNGSVGGIAVYNVEITLSNPGGISDGMTAAAVVHTSSGDVESASVGSFKDADYTAVISRQSGNAAAVYAENGDYVKKGQLLVKIQNDNVTSTLEKARLDRSDLDIKLARLNDNYSKLFIYAPADGTVIKKSKEVHDSIASTKDSVVTIADLTTLTAKISADEDVVKKIKTGDSVKLTVSGTDTVLSGKVKSIDEETVYVTVENTGDLQNGTAVSADFGGDGK